jgi:hypothetical protein
MVATYAHLIGQHAKLTLEKLTITVEVKDIRSSWGNTHALVTPVAYGTGEQWVDLSRLQVLEEKVVR